MGTSSGASARPWGQSIFQRAHWLQVGHAFAHRPDGLHWKQGPGQAGAGSLKFQSAMTWAGLISSLIATTKRAYLAFLSRSLSFFLLLNTLKATSRSLWGGVSQGPSLVVEACI